MSASRTDRSSTVLAALIVVVLALLAGWMMLLGWVLQAVLHGFGVEVSYWPCLGAIVLAGPFLSGRSSS